VHQASANQVDAAQASGTGGRLASVDQLEAPQAYGTGPRLFSANQVDAAQASGPGVLPGQRQPGLRKWRVPMPSKPMAARA
jgi:hypothetical protein